MYYSIGAYVLCVTHDEFNSEEVTHVELRRAADLLLNPAAPLQNLEPHTLRELAEDGHLTAEDAAQLVDLAADESAAHIGFWTRSGERHELLTATEWTEAAEACEEVTP